MKEKSKYSRTQLKKRTWCMGFREGKKQNKVTKKHYKVITVMQQRYPDWVFNHWHDLQEALNNGWAIDRTDKIEGVAGGFFSSARNGGVIYTLSKVIVPLTKAQKKKRTQEEKALMNYMRTGKWA
jgi:hypothetical protein